jgi:hypothetical protein
MSSRIVKVIIVRVVDLLTMLLEKGRLLPNLFRRITFEVIRRFASEH